VIVIKTLLQSWLILSSIFFARGQPWCVVTETERIRPKSWWRLPLFSLSEKWYNNCVWNSLIFSYLASHCEWRCLLFLSFCRCWTRKHSCRSSVIVWGPNLLSTHAPLPIFPPFLSPPPVSLFFPLFPSYFFLFLVSSPNPSFPFLLWFFLLLVWLRFCICFHLLCVYFSIYVGTYLATLSPHDDNNKIHTCRPMITLSM